MTKFFGSGFAAQINFYFSWRQRRHTTHLNIDYSVLDIGYFYDP